MGEEIKTVLKEMFRDGNRMLRLNYNPNFETEVTLQLEREWLPYLHQEVHLLSNHKCLQRQLVYMFVEELIQLLPSLKEEGVIDKDLLRVCETLLLAADYLTHQRFISARFLPEHRAAVDEILQEAFSDEKTHAFSTDANRPTIAKAAIIEGRDKIYCLDERQEKNRLYMAVAYRKPESVMEHFQQVGHWLGKIEMQPNSDRVPYEEQLEGQTNLELHTDLLFALNRIKQTFAWTFNSCSWKKNRLMAFDEMDIKYKLGIR